MRIERVTPDQQAADGRAIYHYRVMQASAVARFAPPFRIVTRTTYSSRCNAGACESLVIWRACWRCISPVCQTAEHVSSTTGTFA